VGEGDLLPRMGEEGDQTGGVSVLRRGGRKVYLGGRGGVFDGVTGSGYGREKKKSPRQNCLSCGRRGSLLNFSWGEKVSSSP